MFGKLMKYEMLSTVRVFGISYLALLAASVLLTISIGGEGVFVTVGDETANGGIFATAMLVLYSCLIVAVCAVTLIFIINRFKNNLLGSEGYLMLTLPVPSWELTLSKTLAALIWIFLSGLAIAVSIFIIGIGIVGITNLGDMFSELSNLIKMFYEQTGCYLSAVMLPGILMCVTALAALVLEVYFSMMVGWQANRHKVLLSVAVFFGVSILLGCIEQPISDGLYNIIVSDGGMRSTIKALWLATGESLVLSAVFFAGTTLLMKYRMNIE